MAALTWPAAGTAFWSRPTRSIGTKKWAFIRGAIQIANVDIIIDRERPVN
jgi:hypothetical protein